MPGNNFSFYFCTVNKVLANLGRVQVDYVGSNLEIPYVNHVDIMGYGFHSIPKVGDIVLVCKFGETNSRAFAMENFWTFGLSPFNLDNKNDKLNYDSIDIEQKTPDDIFNALKEKKDNNFFAQDKDTKKWKGLKKVSVDATKQTITDVYVLNTLNYSIVIDETQQNAGKLIVQSKNGNSVCQISKEGIAFYDKNSVSFFTDGSINMVAGDAVSIMGKKINVDTIENTEIKAGKKIAITGQEEVQIGAKKIILNKGEGNNGNQNQDASVPPAQQEKLNVKSTYLRQFDIDLPLVGKVGINPNGQVLNNGKINVPIEAGDLNDYYSDIVESLTINFDDRPNQDRYIDIEMKLKFPTPNRNENVFTSNNVVVSDENNIYGSYIGNDSVQIKNNINDNGCYSYVIDVKPPTVNVKTNVHYGANGNQLQTVNYKWQLGAWNEEGAVPDLIVTWDNGRRVPCVSAPTFGQDQANNEITITQDFNTGRQMIWPDIQLVRRSTRWLPLLGEDDVEEIQTYQAHNQGTDRWPVNANKYNSSSAGPDFKRTAHNRFSAFMKPYRIGGFDSFVHVHNIYKYSTDGAGIRDVQYHTGPTNEEIFTHGDYNYGTKELKYRNAIAPTPVESDGNTLVIDVSDQFPRTLMGALAGIGLAGLIGSSVAAGVLSNKLKDKPAGGAAAVVETFKSSYAEIVDDTIEFVPSFEGSRIGVISAVSGSRYSTYYYGTDIAIKGGFKDEISDNDVKFHFEIYKDDMNITSDKAKGLESETPLETPPETPSDMIDVVVENKKYFFEANEYVGRPNYASMSLSDLVQPQYKRLPVGRYTVLIIGCGDDTSNIKDVKDLTDNNGIYMSSIVFDVVLPDDKVKLEDKTKAEGDNQDLITSGFGVIYDMIGARMSKYRPKTQLTFETGYNSIFADKNLPITQDVQIGVYSADDSEFKNPVWSSDVVDLTEESMVLMSLKDGDNWHDLDDGRYLVRVESKLKDKDLGDGRVLATNTDMFALDVSEVVLAPSDKVIINQANDDIDLLDDTTDYVEAFDDTKIGVLCSLIGSRYSAYYYGTDIAVKGGFKNKLTDLGNAKFRIDIFKGDENITSSDAKAKIYSADDYIGSDNYLSVKIADIVEEENQRLDIGRYYVVLIAAENSVGSFDTIEDVNNSGSLVSCVTFDIVLPSDKVNLQDKTENSDENKDLITSGFGVLYGVDGCKMSKYKVGTQMSLEAGFAHNFADEKLPIVQNIKVGIYTVDDTDFENPVWEIEPVELEQGQTNVLSGIKKDDTWFNLPRGQYVARALSQLKDKDNEDKVIGTLSDIIAIEMTDRIELYNESQLTEDNEKEEKGFYHKVLITVDGEEKDVSGKITDENTKDEEYKGFSCYVSDFVNLDLRLKYNDGMSEIGEYDKVLIDVATGKKIEFSSTEDEKKDDEGYYSMLSLEMANQIHKGTYKLLVTDKNDPNIKDEIIFVLYDKGLFSSMGVDSSGINGNKLTPLADGSGIPPTTMEFIYQDPSLLHHKVYMYFMLTDSVGNVFYTNGIDSPVDSSVEDGSIEQSSSSEYINDIGLNCKVFTITSNMIVKLILTSKDIDGLSDFKEFTMILVDFENQSIRGMMTFKPSMEVENTRSIKAQKMNSQSEVKKSEEGSSSGTEQKETVAKATKKRN